MYRFHWLERMDHDGQALNLHVAALLHGEPDGLVGLPLEITPDSPRFRVHFTEVGAFKTVPEMFNEVSESAHKVGPFLFQEFGSSYMLEMKDAMELSRGIAADALLHYIVYAENAVTHVLAASPPQVFEGSGNGP
jgi:hypothetical protein